MAIKKKRSIYLIVLFIAIIIVLTFYFVTKTQGKKGHERSMAFEQDMAKMEKHVAHNPEDIDTMWELAERYNRVYRDYEKAHNLLSNILKIDPEHRLAMHLKGVIFVEESKFPEALRQFEEKLTLYDNDPVTLHSISQIYFISDRQKALEYAKRAVEAEKELYRRDNEHTYSLIFEEWEKAVTEFDVKFNEDPAAASLELEEYFSVQPTLMLEVCKMALESSKKSDPLNMQKLLERVGLLYTEIGMDAEAIDIYEELIKTNQEYGKGYVLLANRLAKIDKLESLKDVQDQIQSQQKLVLEKNIIDILMQYQRGETEEAMERLQMMKVDEYNIFINHIIGILYENMGNREDCISAYNEVLNDKSEEHEFWQAIQYEVNKAILSLDS